MSYRYKRNNPMSKLKLSAKRRANKGGNLASWRKRLKNQQVSYVSRSNESMTEEMTVNNPVNMLVEPKFVMDFSMENQVSVPVESISNALNSTSLTVPMDNIENMTDDNVPDKSFPNSSSEKVGTHQDEHHENRIFHGASDRASTKVLGQESDPKAKKNNSKVTEHCSCCRKASASSAPKDLNEVSLPQITIFREISEEQQLKIRQNIERAENKFPGGRFICDLKSVIRQAREIEAHSSKCKFGGSLIYYRRTREGLVHTFYYSCSNPACDTSLKLVTDSGGENLNRLAVIGSSSTGSRFSQEKEKFRVMNMQYMNKNKYSRYERLAGQVVQLPSKATTTEEITVSNPGPMLTEPKIVMDFSVENPVSMPVEQNSGMDFSMENPMSVPAEPQTGMGFSVDSPISMPVELKSGVDLSVENPNPMLVEPKIEMDFSVDSTIPLEVEAKIGMDLSVDNPVPMLVQPKIEMDFHVEET